MSSQVEAALKELRRQFLIHDVQPRHYVLVGSIVMYLHGLKDNPGDIDVFVKPWIWDRIHNSAEWEYYLPDPEDPPYLMFPSVPHVSMFYEWTKKDPFYSAERALAHPIELLRGWRVIPLDYLLRVKRRALSRDTKHVDDIQILEEHLGCRA